jgi:hypothetical protein
MRAIYNAERNIIDIYTDDPMDLYNHVPCSEECRSIWKDGQVLEEGKDYKVGCPVDKTKAYCQYPKCTCILIAYPIKQDNTNEDDLWKDIIVYCNKDYYVPMSRSTLIEELKKKYNITRK